VNNRLAMQRVPASYHLFPMPDKSNPCPHTLFYYWTLYNLTSMCGYPKCSFSFKSSNYDFIRFQTARWRFHAALSHLTFDHPKV